MKTSEEAIESILDTTRQLEGQETQEISTVTPGTGASMQQLARLSETLLAMAAGDFGIRADRTYTRDPFDVLAYLVNNTADELEGLITRVEKQNDQLESILESMADGILLLDEDGFIQRVNRSMLNMLGPDTEPEILNLPITAITAEDSHPVVERFLSDEDDVNVREDVVFTIGDSSETFPTVCSPVRTGNSTAGYVVVVQDDRELRHARTRAQLSDRMTAMGAMAAGVAHEINNPLAYVAANIDFVMTLFDEDRLDTSSAREALVDALDGVRRVREIVADLNSFSRADDESKSLVGLRHVVRSAMKMLSSDLKHRVTLEVDLPELPVVEANEARLIQVFVNILLNAMQALEETPKDQRRISVRARTRDGMATISIRDNGPGIKTDDLPRIFDAFFTTKPVGKGTGLGLAISHQTVQNLGGRIDVDSKPGEGTTFTVVLPVDAGLEFFEAELPTLSEASELIASASILIIDDELPLAKALQRILAATHDITIVTDPEKARDILMTQDFGAVLCDVMMPGVSGIDLYQEAKNARPEMAERFIFMTGGAFTSTAQEFLERVTVPCLRKPFDLSELKEHLERLISD